MTCEALDDRLDDWVDGTLPEAEAREVESHLAACPLCRGRERRLRQLLAHAAALPRSVTPPHDLWPGVAREIGRERAWSWGRLGWRGSVALAAAAAVVVAFLVQQRTPPAVQTAVIRSAGQTSVLATKTAASGIDPSLVAMERDYQAAANALLGALQARKAELAPETLASVERNLAVIDEALTEVRGALEKDPGNPDLSRMLVATHRKKVDVLRRVVKLSTAS